MKIDEGGNNLSVGQKQLLCIVRAILRKSQVMILDEATANIDIRTEETILQLINTEFVDATVITIAHRMNTILKSDMVNVMSMGKMVEYDSPQNLMLNPKSEFS